MGLLQLSRHHVFSDLILTQLPLQALGKLQMSCPQLQHLIQDLPEATWLQAAHTQLPACHPIFSSSHTVRTYLRLHSEIHQGFSPTQVPLVLPQVSVSWADSMTPSPDYTKAAHVSGQHVIVTDLMSNQTLGTWLLPEVSDGSRKESLYFNPPGTHLCVKFSCDPYAPMWPPSTPYPFGYYILDIRAGAMTAALGPFADSNLLAWAPSGQHFVGGAPSGGRYYHHNIVSIVDNRCRVLFEAELTYNLEKVWAPDSTAVVMYSSYYSDTWLWNLSEGPAGVRKLPQPPKQIQELHWSPDSTMICYITVFGQLICHSRHDSTRQSCTLDWHPLYVCLGILPQPGTVTAVFSQPCTHTGASKFTVCTLSHGGSLSLRFTVHLPFSRLLKRPCLSPDGSYLAFPVAHCKRWARSVNRYDAVYALHVYSIKTRMTRLLELDFLPTELKWAADGNRLLIKEPRAQRCAHCWLT